MGVCGREWGHVAGWMYVVGGQAYSMEGDMWQERGYVVGCGGMWQWWWQGVEACGRGWVCGRGQAYGMDGNMWWVGGM